MMLWLQRQHQKDLPDYWAAIGVFDRETSVKVVVTETGNAMGLPLVYEL